MDWFEIIAINEHLFVIRERLDKIEPKFRTKYTNMYLLIGEKQAALIDTGAGVYPIRPLVEKLIKKLPLLVFNTHHHFDHIGGNSEFEEIHIHKLDYPPIAKPVDVGFLKDSPFAEVYEKHNYRLPMASTAIPLQGGEIFDLGGITLTVFHAPGHTPGSIVLYTSEGEVFTGDTVHFGAFYYPSKFYPEDYTEMLQELYDEVEHFMEKGRLFPAHEDYNLPLDVIQELIFELDVFSMNKAEGQFDEFLNSYVFQKTNFTLIIPSENFE